MVEVDPEDRTKVISEPFEIEGWTHFTLTDVRKPTTTLNGTGTTFNGLTSMPKEIKGIYLIQGDNKGWAHNDLVDK